MQTLRATGSDAAVQEMLRIFKENRAGGQRGIYSVCSAHQLVLEAAIAQAARDESLLLIEATCNQVNQEGGYTGLTPERFCDYVRALAREVGFPEERLILGGDHLGPNPWRSASSNAAMEKACAMVKAYASAGFAKIHLDASMACADDFGGLTNVEIAQRTARLCEAAEAAAAERLFAPVYIIGTEVPPPGGAKGELEVEVTETSSVQNTLDLHRAAFEERGLSSVWERVVGVVVQPGVEFGDLSVADYVPERAARLSEWLAGVERIVFEAHSTDYQTGKSLEHLVRDHFAILKVGPELTFSLREAIFGLAGIEEEWISDSKRSDTRVVLDRVMVDHPENWKAYYHGDSHHQRIARAYSQSDRIRYYWPHPDISAAVSLLTQNLAANPAPLPVIEQYLPYEAEAIRREEIANTPHAILLCHIQRTLARYARACGF
jgi:D-tagatose-1,6-bisphosphate aldolase subunit GatZ/KbaZ